MDGYTTNGHVGHGYPAPEKKARTGASFVSLNWGERRCHANIFQWRQQFSAKLVSASLFFSREEPRMHVHVSHSDGEAKFWLEPQIALAQSVGLNDRLLRQAQALIEGHEHDIRSAWQQHFGS